MVQRKVCLIVIDGWGIADKKEGNAILNASTPVMNDLEKDNNRSVSLDASGLAVGLPAGLMGNSEVGHLTIGSGRALYQDLVRINLSIDDPLDSSKGLYLNKSLVEACENAKSKNNRLHFAGLVSDGGVHSHINHLFALLDAAKHHSVKDCYVHFFGDGRDTRPTSGVTYVQQLLDKMNSIKYGHLADLVGRYYAMDRDKRWERIKIAYDGLVNGVGEQCEASKVIDLMKSRYEASPPITDEFMTPIIVDKNGRIKDGDVVVFIDYRADRMREIAEAFGIKPPFEAENVPKDLSVYCMTQYNSSFGLPVLFPPQVPDMVLAECISKANLTQYHVAETEKYAHVTFFFNGGKEQQFEKEERCMVPSPKVATYDLLPEMNSAGVADEIIKAVEKGEHPFVMCNFAPPDMVGHTGKYEPAVKACTATDFAIGRIKDACAKNDYVLLITSDHGNAEQMISLQGGPHTAHTTNRVPFNMFDPRNELKFVRNTRNNTLQDVAPTILALMGVNIPSEMSGISLLDIN